VNKFQHKNNTDQTLHQSLQNSPSTPTTNSSNYSFNGVNRANGGGADTPLLKSMHKQHFQELQTPTTGALTPTNDSNPNPVFSLSVNTDNHEESNHASSAADLTANFGSLQISEVGLKPKPKSNDATSNSGCSASSGSSSGASSSSDDTTTNEYMDLMQAENAGETVVNTAENSNSPTDHDEILPVSESSTSCSSVSNSNEQVDRPRSCSISNGVEETGGVAAAQSSHSNIPSGSSINLLLVFKSTKLTRTTSLGNFDRQRHLVNQSLRHCVSAPNLANFCCSSTTSETNENVYSSIFELRNSTRKFISKSESNLMFIDQQDSLFSQIKEG
jgi:hypothetical protein